MFWEVEETGHADLLNYDRDDYMRHVMPFLAKYLHGQGVANERQISLHLNPCQA